MRQLFFALLYFLVLQHVNAATYYFSSNSGNDERSEKEAQSPSTPWKTIDKLNSVMGQIKPGDKILFKRGEVFYGAITILRSGFEGQPITFSVYGEGAKPVITGLVTLTNWTPTEGHKGVYESSAVLGNNVNIFLINNMLQQVGRYPNVDAPNKGYLTFESHNKNISITDNELPATPDWTGAQAVVRRTRWKLDRLPVVSQNGGTLSFKMDFSTGAATTKPSEYDNYGYFIQKDIRTLDQFGEWYYDPSSKKMYVYLGEKSPSSFSIKATSVPNLISSNNNSNLTFDNLALRGADTYAMSVNNSKNIIVKNCDISFSGNTAISAGKSSTNFTIQGCNISYSNSWGIRLGNSVNSIVKSNIIRNSGAIAGMGESDSAPYTALEFGGSENQIANNEIDSSGYIGIHLLSGNNHTVRNNVINTFGFVKDDCGGIYWWQKKSDKRYPTSLVTGNIVLNGVGAQAGTNSPNSAANGIYMDDNATGVQITGNTVANTFRGIVIHNADNIEVRNNTLFNNAVGCYMQYDGAESSLRNNTIVNNTFFSKRATQLAITLQSKGNDIDSIGIVDSNYYYGAFNNEKIFKQTYKDNLGKNISQALSLTDLKTNYKKDFASKLVAFKTNNNNGNSNDQVKFEYNSSDQNKIVNLDGNYKDTNNNSYKKSVIIKPYSSIILLKQQGKNSR